jgi:hypothetical protein
MEPPVFWAKIALDLPDLTVELPGITSHGGICLTNKPGPDLSQFCWTLVQVLPAPRARNIDHKWLEFNASCSPISVFCQRLKFLKKQADWAIRQGSHRLQAWVQADEVSEDGEVVEDLLLYIAADTQEDFEFIVRTVCPGLKLSLFELYGSRVNECSPLAIHNPIFCSTFPYRRSIQSEPAQIPVVS